MTKIRHLIHRAIAAVLLTALIASSTPFMEAAAPGSGRCLAVPDREQERDARKLLPIQSNSIPGWPEGPAIGAQSAILMEMNTHTILYAKNIHEKSYPASTTKILTCLLAMQNCSMDETITFSHDSIYDVPGDGSKLGGIDTGDTMLMETALYCVLVQSANEVASAVGEHVSEKLGKEKSVTAFAELMNEKAEELGCQETHFTNCNGLYDDEHYTSAYDLALIGCEFFGNELLCKMSSTPSYHFKLDPADEEDTWIASKNQLYKGRTYAYPYLLGSKTGFVSQARQTLISAAEKNGMKLVCVIFAEETPYQFEDTITLFQYGFENFQRVSINDNETRYSIHTMDLFDSDNDLFGDPTPLISMEKDAYMILPNTAAFSDAAATLTYAEQTDSGQDRYSGSDANVIATIHYTYSDVEVGSCDLVFFKSDVPAFSFGADERAETDKTEAEMPETAPTGAQTPDAGENDVKVIYINVKLVLLGILAAAALIILIISAISVINSYSFSPKGQSSKRRRLRKKESRASRRQARKAARIRRRHRKRRR